MGGYRQQTTDDRVNAIFEAGLNLRLAESGAKKNVFLRSNAYFFKQKVLFFFCEYIFHVIYDIPLKKWAFPTKNTGGPHPSTIYVCINGAHKTYTWEVARMIIA